jgi:hypothetical protein
MAGSVPEGARPLLDELARRAKEALRPIIEDAARRATAEMMLKDAESVAALGGKVREAITTAFWNHPTHMITRVAPGTDMDAVLGAMSTAAVDVFLDYLQTVPVPPINLDNPKPDSP